MVLLPGFALGRVAYEPLVDELAGFSRAILVELFPHGLRWKADDIFERLVQTLDELDVESASFLSHSFGTGLAVELTARHPERVTELIISDSVALDRRWVLTRDALSGFDLVRLASPRAAVDFLSTAVFRPLQMAQAGWWAFASTRADDIAAIREQQTPCHVVWADRDTLLRRDDGREVARRLGATFHVVSDTDSDAVLDHDWIFRHPRLVPPVLRQLGTEVGAGAPESSAVVLRDA